MATNIKKAQHSLKVIRRFDEDIWGVLALKEKGGSVLNHIYEAYQNNFKYKKLLKGTKKRFFLVRKREKFIYKIVTGEKEFRRRKRTLKINKYLNLLKLRRFYGNLRLNTLKRLIKNFSFNTNFLSKYFIYNLESRLDVILYRSNFFSSIFSARQYINHNKVLVNGQVVNKPSYKVFVGDVVTVSDIAHFYNILKNNLELNKVFISYPNYLEVNYKIGSIMLVRIPNADEIPFPFFMNLKTILHDFSK